MTSYWSQWGIDCLHNCLFRRRSMKTFKLHRWPAIPAHRASNAGNVSIWWGHHAHLNALHGYVGVNSMSGTSAWFLCICISFHFQIMAGVVGAWSHTSLRDLPSPGNHASSRYSRVAPNISKHCLQTVLRFFKLFWIWYISCSLYWRDFHDDFERNNCKMSWRKHMLMLSTTLNFWCLKTSLSNYKSLFAGPQAAILRSSGMIGESYAL